ncbi:MAG: hypothetical protein KAH20_08955 [Methylococcales bacterium]|nr:hypothetical protein [Methylococcales bacterium]
MKISQLKFLCIVLTLPLTAYASKNTNEYHYEGGVYYSRGENESLDVNHWGASFAYYWNPIVYDNKNFPNKEVGFINRLGYIYASYTGFEGDNDRREDFNTKLRTGMRYAKKDLNHAFNFSYKWDRWSNKRYKRNVLSNQRFDLDLKRDTYSLNMGYEYYLLDNLTIGANFGAHFIDNTETKSIDVFASDILYARSPDDYNAYSYQLNTNYLLSLDNQQWVKLTGFYGYVDFDHSNADYGQWFGMGAEHYFTPKTSLALDTTISFIEGNNRSSGKERVGLTASHYFMDQLSMNAGFDYFFNDRNNTQLYTVGINYRF